MKYEEVIDEEISVPGFYQEALEHFDIRKVRATLLVLLAIKLILALCYMGIKTYLLITYTPILPDHTRDSSISTALGTGVIIAAVITVYLAIFLIFVVKSIRSGILVCAWLSILDLMLTLVVVALAIVALVSASTGTNLINIGLATCIIIVIGGTVALLLTISTIISSFELARLLDLQEHDLLP